MTLQSEDARSWAISLGAHALLLLIAIAWKVFPAIADLPREVEVYFAAPEPAAAEPVLSTEKTAPAPVTTVQPRQTPAPPVQRRAPAQPQPSARSTAVTPHPQTASRQPAQTAAQRQASVSGPRETSARGTSQPVPPAQIRSRDQVEFSEQGTGKADVSSGRNVGFESRGERRESNLPGLSSAQRDKPGTGEPGTIARDGGPLSGTPTSSANIDWGGGLSRSRVAGALPVFPKGVSREAVIKVRFSVKPDGRVTGLTLLQKGEPLFEQASLAAMRTWKFNTLPSSLPQQDQQGVATFVFKLK